MARSLQVIFVVLLGMACSARGMVRADDLGLGDPRPPVPLQPFNCSTVPPSPTVPTDATAVRFSDVKVMMALGDSISAGCFMHEDLIVDGLFEFRGDVFSIGGNEGQYTIPNFMKGIQENHQLPLGASVGKAFPLDAIDFKKHIVRPFDPAVFHLNGAQVENVPAQVDYLVQQMKANKNIDMENDWKVLTILIGANNACGACHGRSYAVPAFYKQQLDIVLGKVYASIPRVFVNLVGNFNISGVHEWVEKSDYCKFIQGHFDECGCLMGTDNDRKIMDEASMAYNVQMRELAAKYNAMPRKDMRVVVQPVLEDLKVLGPEFLSGVDCFHPSYLADAAFAVGLWNNMQQPEGAKQRGISYDVEFQCPTETTYLQ